jgi:exodeoxyribonuclease-3
MNFCDKQDCRHVAVRLGPDAKHAADITLHNFYVPAGGDVPDPEVNPKFAHKLAFLDELYACGNLRPPTSERAIIVGDLNVAPLEEDVWSHKQLLKVVSHTPIECEKLTGIYRHGGWIDAMRHFVPAPAKLFTWWSYRSPDWAAADKGRRLDHIWVAPALADRLAAIDVAKNVRGWSRPSDHVPVTATLEA